MMLLGSKSLPLSKFYRIAKILKNQFDLYQAGITKLKLIVKTSASINEKMLFVDATNNTISSLDNADVGTMVYTTDDNFIYLFLKPNNINRTIYVESDYDNVIAFFDSELKEYEDAELTTATEIDNYINVSGSSFVNQDVTGTYSVKAIDNSLISINMKLTFAEDVSAGTRTLVNALTMPSKTPFVIHGFTTDGKHIAVQYNNNKQLIIPSSVGAIEAGTYYVSGVIN